MVKNVQSTKEVDGYRLVNSLARHGIFVDQFGNVCIQEADETFVPVKTLYKNAEGLAAYIYIRLQGKRRHIRISRLVAEAWMDDFDPGKYIFHSDGDASNNHVSNLYQREDHAR